jgi:sugar lactone lactonase YvrE
VLSFAHGRLRVFAGGLKAPSGLAVAPDGALYVSDSGRGRVIAFRGGRGTTVASGLGSPAGLVFDRKGRLVIADGGRSRVYRLDGRRRTLLVGGTRYEGVYGVGGPAVRGSADGADALAYDRRGNLYLAGFNTKTLLLVTPAGRLEEVGADYPYAGGITVTPDGRVLATDRDRVLELTPHGPRVHLDFFKRRFAGIEGFDVHGIAAAPDGTLYLSTWPSGYTDGRDDARPLERYSTVTVFARLRGWSTLRPRRRAIL